MVELILLHEQAGGCSCAGFQDRSRIHSASNRKQDYEENCDEENCDEENCDRDRHWEPSQHGHTSGCAAIMPTSKADAPDE
jgi:hypothetical protein